MTMGPRTKSGQLRLEDVPCPACESSPTSTCLFCMGKRSVPLTRAIEYVAPSSDGQKPPEK